MGNTFSGVFSFDPGDAVPAGSPFLNVSSYDFLPGTVFPTLILNGAGVDLKPKIDLAIGNDFDLTASADLSLNWFKFGIEQLNSGVVPNSIDGIVISGDEMGFDSNFGTGFEITLFSFDPAGAALPDEAVPDPLMLLGNTFFLFQEYVRDEEQAAGYGVVTAARIIEVPEPAALAIFGLGLAGLGLMRRRKRAA